MIKSIINDVIVSCFLEGAGQFFTEKIKQRKIFGTKYLEIENILSKKKLKKIINQYKEKSLCDMEFDIKKQIKETILQNEDSQKALEAADDIVNEYWDNVIKKIKAREPDLYLVYCEEKKDLEILKKGIYTIEDINKDLSKKCKYKTMNLDYFDTNDREFEKEFYRQLKNNTRCIYISGQSKEETFYRVLSYAKDNYPKQDILIIRTEEAKRILEEKCIKGKLLFYFLNNDEITAIENNMNVFIYTEYELCMNEQIKLRRRTCSNIMSALESVVGDTEKARKIYYSTKGYYRPIYRKLFDGKITLSDDCSYLINPSDCVKTIALIGRWCEDNKNDREIIEELFEGKYETIISEIMSYTHEVTPFIVKGKKRYHGNVWEIAAPEEVWKSVFYYIDENPKKHFKKICEGVFVEKNNSYSIELKKGLLRTIIYMALDNAYNQDYVDGFVKRCLCASESEEDLIEGSEYLDILSEASPNEVLNFFERTITKDGIFKQTMIKVFTKKKYIYGERRAFSQGINRTFRILLQYKRTAFRLSNVLVEIASWNLKDENKIFGEDLLNSILFMSYNITCLTRKQKNIIAREYIKRTPRAWTIVANNLYGVNGSVCEICKPKYRNNDELVKFTIDDYRKLAEGYFESILRYSFGICKRWVYQIEHFTALCDYLLGSQANDMRDKVLASIQEDLNRLSDEEKAKIKETIQNLVSRYRKYQNEDLIEPEYIQKCEDLLKKIHLEEMILEYTFLFEYSDQYPLLHPTEEAKKSISNRRAEIHRAIQKKFKEFRDSDLSLRKLLEIAEKQKRPYIGKILAEDYSIKKFEEDVYNVLIESIREDTISKDILGEYLRIVSVSNDQSAVIEESLESIADKDIIAIILLGSSQIKLSDECIRSMSEDVKELFWKNINVSEKFYKATHEDIIWGLEQLRIYGKLEIYLDVLNNNKNKLTNEELYKFTLDSVRIYEDKIEGSDGMNRYYFGEILKKLNSVYGEDYERCEALAGVEFKYFNLLKFRNMVFYKKQLQRTPDRYAKLIHIIYKEDREYNNIEVENLIQDKAEKIGAFFLDIKFFPALENGFVDEGKFSTWVKEFYELLEKQNQKYLYWRVLGKILANGPRGEDGYYPCESVRNFIETHNNDELSRAYFQGIVFSRGFYAVKEGEGSRELSYIYRKTGQYLEEEYPYTADIYYRLSKEYNIQARTERKRAENEW